MRSVFERVGDRMLSRFLPQVSAQAVECCCTPGTSWCTIAQWGSNTATCTRCSPSCTASIQYSCSIACYQVAGCSGR